jgi:hypothetical protein
MSLITGTMSNESDLITVLIEKEVKAKGLEAIEALKAAGHSSEVVLARVSLEACRQGVIPGAVLRKALDHRRLLGLAMALKKEEGGEVKVERFIQELADLRDSQKPVFPNINEHMRKMMDDKARRPSVRSPLKPLRNVPHQDSRNHTVAHNRHAVDPSQQKVA